MSRQFSSDIYFIYDNLEKWNSIASIDDLNALERSFHLLDGGTDVWIFQTYVFLRKRGLNVHLSDKFVAKSICVAHSDFLSQNNVPFDTYILAVRADRDRTFTCQAEIVQSPLSKETEKNYFVPLWTQPNILPRNPSRGSKIERIGYFGLPEHLSKKFKGTEFIAQLNLLNAELVIKDNFTAWTDYSDIDLVLAARDGNEYYLASKPASKLLNGWIAQTPVMVGKEATFHYYKKSHLDFIEVGSKEDVLSAIQNLQNQPTLYSDMIENGKRRAGEYDQDAIAEMWIEAIESHVVPDFFKWQKSSAPAKKLNTYIQKFRKTLRGYLYQNADTISANRIRIILWIIFDHFAIKTFLAAKRRRMNS